MRIVKSVKKENSYNIEGLTLEQITFLSDLVNSHRSQGVGLCKYLKKQFEALKNEEFIPQTNDEWFQDLGRAVAEESELNAGSEIEHAFGTVWCDGKTINIEDTKQKTSVDYDNGETWWFNKP